MNFSQVSIRPLGLVGITLLFLGITFSFLGINGKRPSSTPVIRIPEPETSSPAGSDVRSRGPQGSHASNRLLYMILGIVLGVMMVLLIIFVCMCWCKQRQQSMF